MRALALFVLLATLAGPALAVTPDEIMKDPVLESRARHLSQELRCMVCQNQSIDDSDAPLAHDLRVLVRERLAKGDSDRQVLNFLVTRYGDFVLLKPPLQFDTILLWGLPPAALLAGLAALIIMARRRQKVSLQVPALTPAEQQKLTTLVEPHADGALFND
ncbi:MAG TPA: cytochrome c-type biogenesis protein [Pseudolabrys sp.]|nr:cytochrome c-type biogenesis protein [Pseudolabrys sp.]